MKKLIAAAALLSAALACEPPARTIEPGINPSSGNILATRDGNRLLVASEDHGQLWILDTATKRIGARVDVGEGAGHVIELSDGTAAVSTRYGHSVVVVDVGAGRVLQTIEVGTEPYGLVEIEPGVLAVVLAGEASLAIVDVKAGNVSRVIQLQNQDPRAVAMLPDGELFVTHMATGTASRVNLDSGVARIIDVNIPNQFGPRLRSEHLRSATVDPVTGVVVTPGTCANEDTVRAPIGEPGIDDGGGCGYSGCPTEIGAVPGCTVVVDTVVDQVIVTSPGGDGNGNNVVGAPEMDCFDCGVPGGFGFTPNPAQVLNPFEQRFAGTQINNPVAVAFFDGGRGQLLVNLGSKNALLMKRDLKGRADDVIASVRLGNGAQGVALSPDGKLAYVFNAFDHTISEIELPQVDDDRDARTKSPPAGAGEPVAAAELGLVPEIAANTFSLDVEDVLSAEAAVGRRLFHDATDSRISASGTVSCATCHPDGRNDGRTWKFVFGPRNTPQLGGDILDTAPFHWPGDVPTVAALNDMTVLPFMGGTGLDAGTFQYVASFLGTIKKAPSILDRTGVFSEAELRGADIFYSDAAKCGTCHGGNHYTDNLAWNVNTKAGDSDISTFQTPVLHGLHRSGPYLHDGSQQSLEDLVNNVVRTDKMGVGSHLSDAQAADLVAFLKTL